MTKVGWGAGWTPPYEKPSGTAIRVENETMGYSYLDSPGYCELTLKLAQEATGRVDANFSDLFDAKGKPTSPQLAGLDQNQLAALREMSQTPPEKLRELGILKDGCGRKPETVLPAWNHDD